MKARMRSSVKQYLAAKNILDTLPDDIDDDEYGKHHDRERLLRGVVRGTAQMFLVVANPAFASNKDYINDLEIDYGMPGKRSRQKPQVSDTVSKFLDEYYAE
jgi:hypothetical protein